jgi:hypothetical protein
VVLEVTAKTADGKEIGMQSRHYHPQATNEKSSKMLYGAQVKTAYLRDTSIQPYRTKEESFEFVLPEGVRTAEVTVNLAYDLGNPAQRYEIHRVTKTVTLDR